MGKTTKELALEFIDQHGDGNFFAADIAVTLTIFGKGVEVETVWFSKDEDKVYLHCDCREFEGDIDIASLSEENLRTLRGVFTAYLAGKSTQESQPWVFDEQAFIEQYCPMEGGNDYLGWIDDICKLLDGEAEPGDAASTGEYADCTEEELRKELKRLKTIVLTQAVERYVDDEYMD